MNCYSFIIIEYVTQHEMQRNVFRYQLRLPSKDDHVVTETRLDMINQCFVVWEQT